MKEHSSHTIIISILLSINTICITAALYLFYQNLLAEDMIRELNRDYEELLCTEKKLKERKEYEKRNG